MNASDITNIRQCNITHIKSCHKTNTNLNNTNLHNTNENNTNKIYILNNDKEYKFNQIRGNGNIITNRYINNDFNIYRNVNLNDLHKYILTVNLLYLTDMLDFHIKFIVNNIEIYSIKTGPLYPNSNTKFYETIVIDDITNIEIKIENDNENGTLTLKKNSFYSISNL
jgi:hypothetical protein